jgi:dTDP-4-dehydrorhamnose reductase
MKILITGSNGQLGREFQRLLENYPYKVTAFGREMLDISNDGDVEIAIASHTPDIVLNCAAYNFVDRAEEDSESAFRVNVLGVRNLALSCRKNNSLLVHFSTDYVFDGKKEDFYTEEDEAKPVNKYGETKLSGENFLKEGNDNFLLFRVSWVFGEGHQNFLHKLLDWAKQKKVLKVVYDQISVPTFTRDIAHLTMFAISKGLRGSYHLTSSGYATRYEVARFFLERLGMDNLVLPVRSDSFPSPAKRPYFSAMSNTKLSQALDVHIPDWKISIESYVESVFEKEEI